MPKLTAIRKHALDEMMKEALFEATVVVLSTHGVEGMTMDRVASQAGIAKGSLYRYFRSKRDLLEFVYEKTVDPILLQLKETVASDLTAVEKLSQQLYALLDHVAKYVQVHRLLFDDDVARGLLQSSERNMFQTGSELTASIFAQGIEDGIFRPADPYMLAVMYLGLCRGVLQSRPELEEHEQRKNLHHLILGTFLDGISTIKAPID